MVPSASTVAEPRRVADSSDTVRRPPSGSASFPSTSIDTASPSFVDAVSPTAIGASLTSSRAIVTVAAARAFDGSVAITVTE